MIKSKNRVITLSKRTTSIRLTEIEWKILDKICYRERIHRRTLLEHIHENHCKNIGFTSAVRLFSLIYLYKNMQKRKNQGILVENVLNDLQ